MNPKDVIVASGIPSGLWEGSAPDAEVAKLVELIPARYDNGSNILIKGGTRQKRVHAAAFIAVSLASIPNEHFRFLGEPKHTEQVLDPYGEPVTEYFTFKWMEYSDLEDQYKACQADDSIPFKDYVCEPDFFFLVEVGHETSNDFTERVIVDLLAARMDAGLPLVITLSKPFGNIMDRHGDRLYEEVQEMIEGSRYAEVALG